MTAKVTEIHRRTVTKVFSSKDLSRLLAETALTEVGIPVDMERGVSPPPVTVKVTYEDETEGSPAYKVGTKAIVTIEIDLAAQPDEAN